MNELQAIELLEKFDDLLLSFAESSIIITEIHENLLFYTGVFFWLIVIGSSILILKLMWVVLKPFLRLP